MFIFKDPRRVCIQTVEQQGVKLKVHCAWGKDKYNEQPWCLLKLWTMCGGNCWTWSCDETWNHLSWLEEFSSLQRSLWYNTLRERKKNKGGGKERCEMLFPITLPHSQTYKPSHSHTLSINFPDFIPLTVTSLPLSDSYHSLDCSGTCFVWFDLSCSYDLMVTPSLSCYHISTL